jgi:crotonobetainyl-CoA:carnitine CoA-transferase CaiB-like acyl-CoA transferase
MSVRYGGEPRPQLQANAPVNDYGTGLLGFYAVGLALFHRARTGKGQYVTTALARTAGALQSLYLQDYEGKVWDEPKGQDALGFGPLQRLYWASDDWFFLGAHSSERGRLLQVEGLEGVPDPDGAGLERHLEERFAGDTCEAWVSKLVAADFGAHRLTSIREIMDDPWAREHGLSITREHEGIGLADTIGPAPRLSRTPVVPGRPAPLPGADSRELVEEHGLGARWAELRAAGVVHEPNEGVAAG